MLTTNSEIGLGGSPETRQAMIPGQWEPGSLTRFADSPAMVQTMVDVTLDAAGRADRQREGGGAPSERRPVRPSRWAAVVARMGRWGLRQAPREATPATAEVVAVSPPVW